MHRTIRKAALAAVAALLLTAAPAGAETKLRVTLQLPLSNHLGQNMLDFKAAVERETAGAVTVEIFASAQLYADSEVPQAVASGAIEMGIASLTQFAGTVPAVDVFYVPFLFDSPAKVRAATAPDSPIRRQLDAAILGTGVRVLWWQAFGSVIFVSRNDAIRMPADVRGKTVRVFGKTVGDTVATLGGTPALISGSKQFLAYQRGAVDAGMTGITTVETRRLYEVMDHLTTTFHADIEFVVIINEDVWQALSDSQQAIISTAARRVESDLRARIEAIDATALDTLSDKIDIIALTPGQRQAWRDATRPVVGGFVDRAGPLGAALVEAAEKL